MRKKDLRARLLGLGLDCNDGHTRVTRGENYHLFGGSEQTHERMQEMAARFNEELCKRRKRLEDLDSEEFADIARECDPQLRPEDHD